MTPRHLHRSALLGLAALAVLAAACSSSSSSSTTTAAPSTTGTTATTTATTGGSTATTATTSTSSVQNLVATATDKAALTAAFVAYDQLPAADIAGTRTGSVYLAVVPSTGTTWALASFDPTTTASQQTLVRLQDGGETAIFSKKSGAGWVVLSNGSVPFCPAQTALPAAVIARWALTSPEGCTAEGTTTTAGMTSP